jgi:hypothetical protein
MSSEWFDESSIIESIMWSLYKLARLSKWKRYRSNNWDINLQDNQFYYIHTFSFQKYKWNAIYNKENIDKNLCNAPMVSKHV